MNGNGQFAQCFAGDGGFGTGGLAGVFQRLGVLDDVTLGRIEEIIEKLTHG